MWRIERHATLPSTSDRMLVRIRAGETGAWDVIVAAEQTAGRGRQGRSWLSEPGGLWMTAALPTAQPIGQMALVAAVALCEAARQWVPEAGVKWPNDLLIDGRKCGGVLVEWPAGADVVAVGIGVNVARAPRDGTDPSDSPSLHATALAAHAVRPVDPEELLGALLGTLAHRWDAWRGGDWLAIRETWIRMDLARGRRVRVAATGVEGWADGIDLQGALQIRDRDGARFVATAGEVMFLGEL